MQNLLDLLRDAQGDNLDGRSTWLDALTDDPQGDGVLNLTKLREKLSHPITQLALIIALQLSSRWNARFPWLALPRMALWLWLGYSLFSPLFRRKSPSEAPVPRKGFPWRPIAYLLGVILIAFVWV